MLERPHDGPFSESSMPRLFFLVFLSACLPRVGNGIAAEETRSADGAIAFNNASPVEAVVCVGDEPGVVLSCDSNLLDEIVTEVVDGELRLGVRPNVNISTRAPCVAGIVLAELDAVTQNGSGMIDVPCPVEELTSVRNHGSAAVRIEGAGALQEVGGHGSGDIIVRSVRGCELSVEHSGSGGVFLGDVDVCEVNVSNGGSGATTLIGAAEEAFIGVAGSGAVRAEELVVSVATVEVTSSGSAHITVTDAVEVSVEGSGSAHIHGNPPERNVNTSGSGSVVFD